MGFRFHYRRYLGICEAKGIEPKARAPDEFKNKYVAWIFILLQKTDDTLHEGDRNR